jgi:hypothetical protein
MIGPEYVSVTAAVIEKDGKVLIKYDFHDPDRLIAKEVMKAFTI